MWHIVDGEVALTIAGEEQVLGAGCVAVVPPRDAALGAAARRLPGHHRRLPAATEPAGSRVGPSSQDPSGADAPDGGGSSRPSAVPLAVGLPALEWVGALACMRRTPGTSFDLYTAPSGGWPRVYMGRYCNAYVLGRHRIYTEHQRRHGPVCGQNGVVGSWRPFRTVPRLARPCRTIRPQGRGHRRGHGGQTVRRAPPGLLVVRLRPGDRGGNGRGGGAAGGGRCGGGGGLPTLASPSVTGGYDAPGLGPDPGSGGPLSLRRPGPGRLLPRGRRRLQVPALRALPRSRGSRGTSPPPTRRSWPASASTSCGWA